MWLVDFIIRTSILLFDETENISSSIGTNLVEGVEASCKLPELALLTIWFAANEDAHIADQMVCHHCHILIFLFWPSDTFQTVF
jgi:hypothetical protein